MKDKGERIKTMTMLIIRNLKSAIWNLKIGSFHPDPRHWEWRPIYLKRCPSIVKEENEQFNLDIIVTFFAVITAGLAVALTYALMI